MSNPVLRENSFSSTFSDGLGSSQVMSINGTIMKTCLLGLFTALTFAYTWSLQMAGFADKVSMLQWTGIIGGFILALFITFGPKNKLLPITTTLYALCEGMVLGGISALANQIYPGIASQAAIGTLFALFGMFFLYRTNLVKATDKFRMIIINSTLAIAGIYLVQLVMMLFHLPVMGIFSNSLIGIAFSVIVVAIASFNLILDFDFIEQFSGRADKILEWYGGFALLVTIIWLYIEILNLLMKLQSRR